jgi:predicted nucleotidyltransferase
VLQQINEIIDKETLTFKESLNKEFWNDDETLVSGLKDKLLALALLFFTGLKLPDKIKIHDIAISGSLAGYNYTKYSDLDLHVIIDYNKVGLEHEFIAEFMKMKKDIWEEMYDIEVMGYPVELYAQDLKQFKESTSPQYSLVSDKWLVKQSKSAPNFDKGTVIKKAEKIMHDIDVVAKSHVYDEKIEAITQIMNKIKTMRGDGIEKDGEFSVENMVFKVLRNEGYLEKIGNIKKDAIEKLYSITKETINNTDEDN